LFRSFSGYIDAGKEYLFSKVMYRSIKKSLASTAVIYV